MTTHGFHSQSMNSTVNPRKPNVGQMVSFHRRSPSAQNSTFWQCHKRPSDGLSNLGRCRSWLSFSSFFFFSRLNFSVFARSSEKETNQAWNDLLAPIQRSVIVDRRHWTLFASWLQMKNQVCRCSQALANASRRWVASHTQMTRRFPQVPQRVLSLATISQLYRNCIAGVSQLYLKCLAGVS